MSDWPIGISTGCFYQSDILDILEVVRDGGFSMIEVCSFPKHLDYHDDAKVKVAARRIREVGLDPFSFHAPFADHIDITSLDDEIKKKSVKELIKAAEAAATLGVKHIVLHPGPEREGRPPAEEFYDHLERACESVNTVAKRCDELGLILLLENMLPHLLFGRTRDMLYIMGSAESDNVGTCLDTGHAHLAGDLASVVHKLSSHLRMVHVNDNRGDSDAHLPPGEGHVDWRQVLSQLEHWNFRGALILELSGRHGENYHQAMSEARGARDYLSHMTL
ncbi:MAG: sugar phosphate isomerase/epimerase [Verrucomicrobiae bacterium]|nr:sugar phosphate isomerase/epimerase [Verrucomicrobiae bacterium]NNJ43811.1 sugar phosphate isomerase/epimerase [Akkermansiaceae bacterium]